MEAYLNGSSQGAARSVHWTHPCLCTVVVHGGVLLLDRRLGAAPVCAVVLCVSCTGSLRPLGFDSGTDETGTDTGVFTPGVRTIAVSEVQPPFGSAGEPLTILGGPFETGDTVSIGGSPAPVIGLSETGIEVAMPELGRDGAVEVRVHPAFAEEPLPEPVPFRYFRSAEGSLGALGMVARHVHVGGYWPPSAVDFSTAEVLFPIGPAPHLGAWRYAPTPDACAIDYVPTPLELYDTGLPAVTLRAQDDAATEITLTADPGAGRFVLEASELDDVPVGPPADLTSTAKSATDWPSFSVSEFAGAVASGFVVTQPAIMGVANPRVRAEFTLRWGGPYDGEVLLTLLRKRWNPSTSEYEAQETITCWLVDDGEHLVPDLWTDWSPFPSSAYDAVDFVVGRVQSAEAVLPHNRGASGVLGGAFILGNAVAE